MSVLIKGMEMPTSCGDCKAFVCYRQWAGDVGDCFCGITKNDAKAKEKNADCPLIPVPEHGRLIDADELTKDGWYLNRYVSDSNGCWIENMTLEDAPTIIPEDGPFGKPEQELVRNAYKFEKKEPFGKSEQLCRRSKWNLDGSCPRCGKHSLQTYGNFCCYCGADMRGEDVPVSDVPLNGGLD